MAVRFSEQEKAEVRASARRAGMAGSAWVGMTATGAARHELMALTQYQRELIAELMRLSYQLSKAGTNLNQAVARVNATGQAEPRLARSASQVGEIADQAERLIAHIRGRM